MGATGGLNAGRPDALPESVQHLVRRGPAGKPLATGVAEEERPQADVREPEELELPEEIKELKAPEEVPAAR